MRGIEAWAKINGPKDVLAGLIFMAIGIGVFILSHDYEIGTALEMKPGYFPALLGVVIAFLGAVALIRGLTAKIHDPIPRHKTEPLFLIFVSVIAFSMLIEHAGLVVAAGALLFFACLRRVLIHPIEVLIMYVLLVSFAAIVFVYWFGMTIPVFWWE